jgi:hypothetical protein
VLATQLFSAGEDRSRLRRWRNQVPRTWRLDSRRRASAAHGDSTRDRDLYARGIGGVGPIRNKKFGVAKTLCWPPNCLRPAKTVSSARVAPQEPKPEAGSWKQQWAQWAQWADIPESFTLNTLTKEREVETVNNLPDSIIGISSLGHVGLSLDLGKAKKP